MRGSQRTLSSLPPTSPPPPSERACSSDRKAAASRQQGRSSGSGDRKCRLHTTQKRVGHIVMHNSCRLDSCSGRYVSTVSNRGDGAQNIKAYKFGPPTQQTVGVHLHGESRWQTSPNRFELSRRGVGTTTAK